jgi:hypothetical protein
MKKLILISALVVFVFAGCEGCKKRNNNSNDSELKQWN